MHFFFKGSQWRITTHSNENSIFNMFLWFFWGWRRSIKKMKHFGVFLYSESVSYYYPLYPWWGRDPRLLTRAILSRCDRSAWRQPPGPSSMCIGWCFRILGSFSRVRVLAQPSLKVWIVVQFSGSAALEPHVDLLPPCCGQEKWNVTIQSDKSNFIHKPLKYISLL